MLHVPCSRCARPLRVDQVHSWLCGDGFCSDACRAAAAATGAYRTPRVARELAERAIGRIDEAMKLAQQAAILGKTAVEARAHANSLPHGHGLITSIAFGAARAAAEAHAEATEEKAHNASWELERTAVDVLRTFMALVELGHADAVAAIQPMVVRYGGILAPTSTPAMKDMQELHGYFEYLKKGAVVLAGKLS